MEVYQAGAGSAKVFAFLIERTRGPRWCSFPPGVIVGIAPGPVAAISVIRTDIHRMVESLEEAIPKGILPLDLLFLWHISFLLRPI